MMCLGMNPGTIRIPKSRDSDKFSNPEIPGLKCRDPGIMKSYENVGILKFFTILLMIRKNFMLSFDQFYMIVRDFSTFESSKQVKIGYF